MATVHKLKPGTAVMFFNANSGGNWVSKRFRDPSLKPPAAITDFPMLPRSLSFSGSMAVTDAGRKWLDEWHAVAVDMEAQDAIEGRKEFIRKQVDN